MTAQSAIWHDLECGSYDVDINCWLQLADDFPGPVLDVGAGSGRLALQLAGNGRDVTALDIDPDLLAALSSRDERARVATICADARAFESAQRFGLIIVAMLTVQLLGGPTGRREFLRRARSQLAEGGCLALAIADLRDDGEAVANGTPAAPDTRLIAGIEYSTQAIALHERSGQTGIERSRQIRRPDGSVEKLSATDWIDTLSASTLESEGAAAGLKVAARRLIPASDEYIGSTVVCFNG